VLAIYFDYHDYQYLHINVMYGLWCLCQGFIAYITTARFSSTNLCGYIQSLKFSQIITGVYMLVLCVYVIHTYLVPTLRT